jgi:MinD-like ATPase involved in chromosome partitioning or flagellar assembly
VTVVTFASVKGAPGVTTMACLVGATWPGDRRVMVAECDPSGGDLAARFGLSSKRGWPTFTTALRRSGTSVALEPHLQQLPGGLDVLLGPGGSDGSTGIGAADKLLVRQPVDTWDVLVDVGRLPEGDLSTSGWLARSDWVVILLRNDATSVLHVRNRAREIHAVCGDRAALVVVGTTQYGNEEIADFTGLPVIGTVPFDPVAAAVAAGGQGNERRLSRSFLINSALHLSQALCGPASGPVGTGGPVSPDQSVEGTRPGIRWSLVRRSITWWRRHLERSVRLLRRRTGGARPVSITAPAEARLSESVSLPVPLPVPVPVPEQDPMGDHLPEKQREVSA